LTTGKSWLEEQLSDPELALEVAREDLILEVTERICDYMAKHGLSRADLARRLGKPVDFVTELLGGGRGLTLRAMADVIRVLGAEAELKLQSVEVKKLNGVADEFRRETMREAGGIGWRDEPVREIRRRARPRGGSSGPVTLIKGSYKSVI
jgi:plasmid maintenance system antidote protein VapI